MPAPLSILVVEDHDMLRDATIALLRENGHDARGARCAEDVDDLRGMSLPDLYVIDLGLPGEDGLSLARRLRQARPGVGIIMATARTLIDDRVAGYHSGADIYLPKPVDPVELLAAIRALSHRIKPAVSEHALQLDVQRLRLRGPSGDVTLTATEAGLLTALAQANLQTLERWQVAVHLKLDDGEGQRASLDVRLSQLRKKLRDAGAGEPCLQSIRNHGYRLCLPISIS